MIRENNSLNQTQVLVNSKSGVNCGVNFGLTYKKVRAMCTYIRLVPELRQAGFQK